MTTAAAIDAALDRAPLGPLQIRVAIGCAIVAMLDGFDTQAIAFVAPVLGELWGIGPQYFGLVFAAGLIGIMVGQIGISPLADRVGRRPVILWCTAIFAAGSLVTALAGNWIALLVLRFLTGIGLGGATPNLIALTAEYSPPRIRSTMITAMFAGFPLGAAIGAWLSSHLIPAFGWQSVFVLGGAAPLLLLTILLACLPESPQFLLLSGRDPQRLRALLARLTGVAPAAPAAPVAAAALAPAPRRAMLPPLGALFSGGRSTLTPLLWVAYFLSLMMIYFLMSWLPAMTRKAGLPLDTAIISSVFLNLGGALGGVLLGLLSDRLGAFRTLAVGYAVAGCSIAAIGFASSATSLLMVLAFVAGLCTIGGQTAMNAAAAGLYPVQARATALGAALAVGRIGSITGPTIGGLLLASGWPLALIFSVAAAPALVTSAITLAIAALLQRRPPAN